MAAPDSAAAPAPNPALPPRQLPALERGSCFYWEAGAEGRLLIQRCACGTYQHPPLPLCPACGSEDARPEPVSGRARVKSFTVNHQVWRPGLPVPYVFAVVELAEQAELYVFTNIEGCAADAVRIGMPVTVTFEHRDDVWLPIFVPAGEATNA